MEYSKLLEMRNKIEQLPNVQQIEVLRILHTNNKNIMSENLSGVHINLINVDTSAILEIQTYLTYVKEQEVSLYETEKQKDDFKKEFKNICLGK